jgi:regulator of sigma E protease
MTILLLIFGLIMFIGLVVVHEWGHFIAARRSGVVVEEFGLGFPPRAKIVSKKRGTIYSLNWLPLGGFVRLKGEHDSDTTPGSFGAATTADKIKIMLAGVGMNLLVAYILFTVLALMGMPRLVEDQFVVTSDVTTVRQDVLVGYVEPNSPAEKAGIRPEDKLISVDNELVGREDALKQITQRHEGQTVVVVVKRGGEMQSFSVLLRSTQEVEASRNSDNPKGYLGVGPTEFVLQRSTWSAPIVALGTMKQFTQLTFQGLGHALGSLFRGNTAEASSQVSGPVGIFVLLKNGSAMGVEFVLIIVAVISLTLALINVLPIPALDGGRLFLTLLFRFIRKPLGKGTEEKIHGTGFALLILLFVLITIVDVKRNF